MCLFYSVFLYSFVSAEVQVQCSLDGARRSAASVVTAQYVTLRQLMLSLPTVARVLEVTCDV